MGRGNVKAPPAPLLQQAVKLRTVGNLPYRSIAYVMGEYHGAWYGTEYWRAVLHVFGGIPYDDRRHKLPSKNNALA